jgi:hypothetical protein
MTISRASLDNFHDTATAHRADELAHTLDAVPARTFLSYSREGVLSCTLIKKYCAALHGSVSGCLRFQVRENDGVLVERNPIALARS